MYSIINKTTRASIRDSETPFNIDDTVQPPSPAIQLKHVYDDTRPAFDPATQKLNRVSVDNDAAFARTFSYTVMALTAPEQAAITLAAADESERQRLKTIYNDLKNSVGTAGERITRVEKAVAWILREAARN